ncbi:pilus assembly protein PilM [Sulfurihydrogenibium sp.]|uniref:pilus assembly protein PilM n=1 Tax=Sulfurihydrogenibium sp. TaxID=2053621 RepID=UPI00260CBBCB|nr:pilus assembly protein PilM [Sulfurihydrogenibium sp.]
MPFEIQVSGDNEQDGKILKNEIERRGLNVKSAAFSIPVSSVLYKTLNLPKVDEKELIDAIEWNIREDIENFRTETHYDWDILSSDGEFLNNVVVITKKEVIDRILDISKVAGIDIEFIDTAGTSLLNLAFLQKEKVERNKGENNICVIHLDKNDSFIIFSQNNVILQTLDFNASYYENLEPDEKEQEIIRIINEINYLFLTVNEPKVIYTSGFFVKYPEIKAYMQLKFSTQFILEDLDPVLALGLDYQGSFPLSLYNNALSLAYRSIK